MKGLCELCGRYADLERHHVFFGTANRRKSEKYGLTAYLCHDCHNEPPYGVHHNREANRMLQAKFQQKWMDDHGKNVDDFIVEFGRNYIEEGI